MITLIRMLSRGRSSRERTRGRLMAAGAALATVLLCLALHLTAFRLDERRGSLGVLTEKEPRLMVALTLALLAVPAVAFLYQVSRLTTATRERRLAALRLAGATPREVRLVGAAESGRSALVGGSLGVAVYLLAALVARWSLGDVVPVRPLLWTSIVLAAVVLVAAWSGLVAGRHVIASPLGVVRRARPRGPRARDLGLVALGVGLLASALTGKGRFFLGNKYGAAVAIAAGAVLLLFGLVLATAWLVGRAARRAGRTAARRAGRGTSAPETLLAARMVEADPRAWARALSVVGLTVFFGSAVAAQQTLTVFQTDHLTAFQVTAYTLVYLALLAAMVTSAGALVVHQAEELLDHRRSFAVLAASGVPVPALGRVLTRQALIAALPVCVVSAVAGAGVVVLAVADLYLRRPGALAASVVAAAMAGIGVLAAVLVARAARPILRRWVRPEELRAD
ncbi:FtsX-like permease family protein [Streptosporangium sp. NPDC048047]|uniref:FtsX-like permease family protein n=1 Tax=Streptosporangium sp. NPDC048047 TaxID=3155748 RepID=UPI00342E72D8